MKYQWLFIVGVLAIGLFSGCTVVSANRVFPKLAWYWSADAKMQRAENQWEAGQTNAVHKQ